MDGRNTEYEYILELAEYCDKCSIAYWKKYYYYKSLSTILNIPVLFLSSGTALVSQLMTDYCTIMVSIVTGFGITSAVLVALQRYKGYEQKATTCRNFAKSFDRIARHIHFRDFRELRHVELSNFIIHLLDNINELLHEYEYDDIPIGIIKPKKGVRREASLPITQSAPSAIWLDMAASTLNAPIISHRTHCNQAADSSPDSLSSTKRRIPNTKSIDIRSLSSTHPVNATQTPGVVCRSKSFTYSSRTYSGDTLV